MNIAKERLIWLLRMRYRKGYGVHSPFAYEFIRCVINEHGQFYAYRGLHRQFRQGRSARRRDELLFRLANRFHPENALLVGENTEREGAYVKNGYMKASIGHAKWNDITCHLENSGEIGLIYFDDIDSRIMPALEHAGENSVMIVRNIQKNREIWKEIMSDWHCGITFDLYDAGICLFDRSIYKQHYKVNFF